MNKTFPGQLRDLVSIADRSPYGRLASWGACSLQYQPKRGLRQYSMREISVLVWNMIYTRIRCPFRWSTWNRGSFAILKRRGANSSQRFKTFCRDILRARSTP